MKTCAATSNMGHQQQAAATASTTNNNNTNGRKQINRNVVIRINFEPLFISTFTLFYTHWSTKVYKNGPVYVCVCVDVCGVRQNENVSSVFDFKRENHYQMLCHICTRGCAIT